MPIADVDVHGQLGLVEDLAQHRELGQGEAPPGIDEQLLRDAGFVDIRVEDVTRNMSEVASRWREARAFHKRELDEAEGVEENATFQHFLDVVDTLARERRLSRLAYVATKP